MREDDFFAYSSATNIRKSLNIFWTQLTDIFLIHYAMPNLRVPNAYGYVTDVKRLANPIGPIGNVDSHCQAQLLMPLLMSKK